MNLDDVLALAAERHIVLEARGDRLHVAAPHGAITPAFRLALEEHKAALLVRLAPPRFVTLKGSHVIVPVPAIQLALQLEAKGCRMTLEGDDQVRIGPGRLLTDDERQAIRYWRRHLVALVHYVSTANDVQ